jgi:uncharacterized membrane protein YesL
MSDFQISIGVMILSTLLIFAFFTPLPALVAYALSLLTALAGVVLFQVVSKPHQKK